MHHPLKQCCNSLLKCRARPGLSSQSILMRQRHVVPPQLENIAVGSICCKPVDAFPPARSARHINGNACNQAF
jgi:hypothetical protein